MSAFKGTPGPWQVCNGSDVFTLLGARNASGAVAAENDGWHIADCDMGPSSTGEGEADIPHAEKRANARLIAAAPELLEALHEGRRAIGDHHAPNDCYATGPVTGDAFRDLVECPACAFIAKYDAAIAKATGGAA